MNFKSSTQNGWLATVPSEEIVWRIKFSNKWKHEAGNARPSWLVSYSICRRSIGKFELLHDHFVIYFVIYNFERKGIMNIEAETLFDGINGTSKEIGDILRGELSLIFMVSLWILAATCITKPETVAKNGS